MSESPIPPTPAIESIPAGGMDLESASFTVSPPGAETRVTRDNLLPRSRGPAEPHPEYIGRFRVVREIARGRFGIVYEGIDEQLDRSVAIKRARSEVLDDADQVRRFAHEAELASSLDHPGIVPIYEVGAMEDELFIVMGLCSDRTLGKWMADTRDQMTPGRAARLTLQIAAAVAHGHDRGVIHRDLKPENIGVTDAEVPGGLPTLRILDFGLSYNLEDTIRQTRSSVTMGTPLYMAPEQLRTSDVGTEADVYAIGSILYELLTGRTPFRGSTSAEIVDQLWRERPTPPSVVNSLVVPELEAICMKCLEKRAAERYASANELIADLERWLAGKPTRARPDSLPRKIVRWASKASRVNEAGAVLVMVHLFLPVWSFGGQLGAQIGADGFSAAGMVQMLTYLILMTIPLHAAFTLVGYRMWQGAAPRRAMWMLVPLAMIMLSWHFGRAVGLLPPPSAWYAARPSTTWMVFWMLSLTSAIDLAALALSLFADRRSRAAMAERSGMSSVMDTEITIDED